MFKCNISNCNSIKHEAKGYCKKHYQYAIKHGQLKVVPHVHHGMSKSPENRAYRGMLSRVNARAEGRAKRWYADRGIKVSPEFIGPNGFKNFLAEVGMKPTAQHTLDRKDSFGNYEPGNIRWATWNEQGVNKTRKNKNVGVSKIKSKDRWFAYMYVDGKRVLWRQTKTEEEAIILRAEAELKYFGRRISE